MKRKKERKENKSLHWVTDEGRVNMFKYKQRPSWSIFFFFFLCDKSTVLSIHNDSSTTFCLAMRLGVLVFPKMDLRYDPFEFPGLSTTF